MAMLYFLKANIILAVLTILYQTVFRRDSRLSLNRWILIGIPFVAFLLPIIPALPVIHHTVALPLKISAAEPAKHIPILPIYFFVTLILITRLILQHIRVWRIILNSRQYRTSEVTICHPETSMAPFTYFKYMVVGPSSGESILTHEKAHAQQLHSFDTLLSELVCCLCWINPFVYRYRRSVRLHVEFLADKAVSATNIDQQDYQRTLLNYALGRSGHTSIIGFSSSQIRQRIAMMNNPEKISSYKYCWPFTLLLILHLSLNAAPLQHGIWIDGRTETVRISLSAEQPGNEPFKGIYLIGDKQYNDAELRKMLEEAGEIRIPLVRRPIVAYFTPGDKPAMERWGEKAAQGVILVTPMDK